MSRIALVGEAYGVQEERQRKPFVGPAGHMLDTCLHQALITRSESFITNVFNARPPSNDVSVWLDLSRRQPLETDFYHRSLNLLRQDLAREKPNVVVALGNVPLYALTGQRSIMKYRGSILESTLVPGLKVVPTIHPAAALRQFIFTYSIVFDLKRVREESEFPELRLPKRDFILEPDLQQVADYLEACKKKKLCAFDIEVLNNQVNCISFSHEPLTAICIPFLNSSYDNYWSEPDELVIWQLMAEVLEDETIKKVAQNGLFDCTFLAQKTSLLVRGFVADTMVGFHLLYPDLPKGLDYICSVCTREPYYKDEGKHWHPKLDWSVGWNYNCKDSAVTLESWHRIRSLLGQAGLGETYDFVTSLLEPLVYMNLRGIPVKRTAINEFVKNSDQKLAELQTRLNAVAGAELNPNSPKQLQTYFYILKGENPYVSRKTGNPTVDDDALQRLARKGYEEAHIIQEMRSIRKLTGTYLDIELDSDDRMRCSYNPAGTTTGRLSSSKTIFGTGLNLQNVPKEARQFMVADLGKVLVEVDLSQAEARVVAYLSNDPNMIGAFETGKDIHQLTATLINASRQIGKTVNHASNYDMGFTKLSLLLGCPQKEAKDLLEKYHAVYPGVRHVFHQGVQKQLRVSRSLTNLLGRKRLFMERWTEDLFRQAYAFIPQSSVVDILNRGLVQLYESDRVDILAQVHDSILFQFDENLEAETLWWIKKTLEQPLHYQGYEFTIPAELKIGLNWRDMEPLDATSLDRLDGSLRVVYGKLRAAEAVSSVDRTSSHSGCPSEKVLS